VICKIKNVLDKFTLCYRDREDVGTACSVIWEFVDCPDCKDPRGKVMSGLLEDLRKEIECLVLGKRDPSTSEEGTVRVANALKKLIEPTP